jgi:hypothetical protein
MSAQVNFLFGGEPAQPPAAACRGKKAVSERFISLATPFIQATLSLVLKQADRSRVAFKGFIGEGVNLIEYVPC